MYVIIDSTALHDDYPLKSVKLEKLLIEAKKGDHHVFFPEVVVREMKKHYKESLERNKESITKELRDFQRRTEEVLANPITEELLRQKNRSYSIALKKRIKELGIGILPLPPGSESSLLDKALGKIKPFDAEGKGYQDALIWATIMAKAEEFSGDNSVSSARIIFISNNHTDFCVSDKFELHPNLVNELEDYDINAEVIKIVPTIDEAFKMLFVKGSDVISKDIQRFLQSPQFIKSDLLDDMKKKLMKYLPHQHFFSEEVGFPDIFEEPTVDMFHEDFVFEMNSVEVLSDDEIAIQFDVSVTLLLDIFIHKSDLAYLSADKMPSVYDYDWSDYVALAQKEKKVWFTIDLLSDGKLTTIKNFDIEINAERNQEPIKKFRSRDL